MTSILTTDTGIVAIFSYDFMRQAFIAGIPIAALAGFVGYFMVLRNQIFTGDAVSHAAFTGALLALVVGVDPRWGLFAATVAVAFVLGWLDNRGRADDVATGTVFAWILGIGVLALSIFSASPRAASHAAAGANILFGSILGLSRQQSLLAAIIAVVLIGALLFIARPLLFASLDEGVAMAKGVPTRMLGFGFLLIVAATAAEATQAVGALLLLGLCAAPAGAAHRLADRPYYAMFLAAVLSVASLVLGLIASYLLPRVPPSFTILAVASAIYAGSFLFPHRGTGARYPSDPQGVTGSCHRDE
jgi:zinc/manganese transport system permease protein